MTFDDTRVMPKGRWTYDITIEFVDTKRRTGYSDVIVEDGLRVTLDAYQGNVYIALKTILIYFTNAGGQCTITIEKAKKTRRPLLSMW